MKTHYAKLLILCILFVPLGSIATDSTSQSTIPGRATFDLFLNQISHYSAHFKQSLYDEYGELLEDSVGQVLLSKPGKFRWEYLEPYRQQIVSNGSLLWVYDEDLEQVTINRVPEDAGQSPLALLVNGIDIESRYEIEAVERDDSLSWLGLTPRTPDSEYQRVEIGVDDSDVIKMRLHDNLNQVTHLEFSNANKISIIDQQTFEFSIPAGVDVVNGVVE